MKYKSKRKPRAHQAEALKIMAGREAFGLFMAMRTGKTKTTIDETDLSALLAKFGSNLP